MRLAGFVVVAAAAVAHTFDRGAKATVPASVALSDPAAPRNVSAPQLFFGGVSVFLEQHVPLFRHTPAFLDRLRDSTPVLLVRRVR